MRLSHENGMWLKVEVWLHPCLIVQKSTARFRLFATALQLRVGGKSFLLGRNSYRVALPANCFISAIYSLVGKLQ